MAKMTKEQKAKEFCNEPYSMDTTNYSIESVRRQMGKKINYSKPFLPTGEMVKDVVTDFDNFPYNRFFRGVYYKDNPIVVEREAGWRPHEDKCYKKAHFHEKRYYPNHCFEAPCSIVYPCYPGYLRKWSDKTELELFLNRTCISHPP